MSTILTRRGQGITAVRRRRPRALSRQGLHYVRWGGFCLTIRLHRFRGWEPVAFDRLVPVKLQLWPLPPEGEDS